MNPGGSIKDRAALYVVKDAEEKGLLREDDLRKQPPLTVQELRWRTDKFGRKKRVLVW